MTKHVQGKLYTIYCHQNIRFLSCFINNNKYIYILTFLMKKIQGFSMKVTFVYHNKYNVCIKAGNIHSM